MGSVGSDPWNEVIWGRGGNDVSKWLSRPLVDILLHLYIIYIYISKKNPDPSSYLLCISCFWGENQKRVHIPSGWILFRLAYGVHRNRWNLSFQLALVPEFSMSATSKGSKFDLSPQWKNGGWSSGFPFRKFMISEISQSFKKNLCQLPENLCIPVVFPPLATYPCNLMLGRWNFTFWNGPFSANMLVFRGGKCHISFIHWIAEWLARSIALLLRWSLAPKLPGAGYRRNAGPTWEKPFPPAWGAKLKTFVGCIIWVFPKIVVSQNWWFIMENPIKWMIWGYHYFRKHPFRCPAANKLCNIRTFFSDFKLPADVF